MKVKIVNPENAKGMLDPHTRHSPFIDQMTGATVEVAEVPDDVHWTRRLLAGEIELVTESTQPTGREPIAPLTTR